MNKNERQTFSNFFPNFQMPRTKNLRTRLKLNMCFTCLKKKRLGTVTKSPKRSVCKRKSSTVFLSQRTAAVECDTDAAAGNGQPQRTGMTHTYPKEYLI